MSAAVGLVIVAAACSSSPHRRALPTSTTAAVTPSTTTTVAPDQFAPSPYVWNRSASPSLAVGGGPSATLAAVLPPQFDGSWLVFGSRTVAAGPASGGPAAAAAPAGANAVASRGPIATVWSSADALTWSASSLPAPAGISQVAAAAQYKSVTVAVGSTGSGADQQPAVWLSPTPGAPFAAEPVPAVTGPSAMDLVATGALGLFAAGTVDGRFAMWGSTTGRQWSEITSAEKVITGAADAQVNALLADADAVYAAGSVQSGPTRQPALWVTTDGLDWHLVASAQSSFAGPGDRVIYSLAPLGTGLVAVGAIDTGTGWQPASWISPDGQTWSLPSTDFPAVPHQRPSAYLGGTWGSAARSVAAVTTFVGSTEVVATGGGPTGQGVWISSDGLHWASLGLPATDAASTSWRAEAAASTIDTTVVMDADPGRPYLLTDHRPAASGSAGSAGAAAPVGQWSQPSANPAIFGPVRPQAVPVAIRSVAGQLRLSVDVVTSPQAIGRATVANETLVSSDGVSWAPAPAGSAAPGPTTTPAPGALTAHLPATWVAVTGAASAWPEAWTSATGATWTRRGPLTVPTTGSVGGGGGGGGGSGGGGSVAVQATANGVCTARLPVPSTATSTGNTASSRPTDYVVASVGAATQLTGTPGSASQVVTRSAAGWVSSTGSAWQAAGTNAGPPAGGTQSMSGCLAVGSSLYAYGTATGSSGAPVPAVWRSADGTSWARSPVGAFVPGTPTPLLSVAPAGSVWLAAANPDPDADPLQPAGAGSPGPGATAAGDAGVGPAPSLEDGRDGVWLSITAGSTWQLIDTLTGPWLGAERSEVDLVGFAGHGSAAKPVVVGVVDGELAVWAGTAVF